MYPSPSSSTDPNAAGRHAIAAFANNRIHGQDGQSNDVSDDGPANNQANILAGLNPRRTTNQDRLNAIARNIGSHVSMAMELIDNGGIATPSIEAVTSSASSMTIDRVCQYLRDRGYAGKTMANAVIQNRLNSVNLSAETFLAALETTDNAHHPLWATLPANDSERSELIARLAGIVALPQGFHPRISGALQQSNNNSEQMIANLLGYIRRLN